MNDNYQFDKWVWLAHHQHHICANDCDFNLATLLPNGFLISTIGELYDRNNKIFLEIGDERFYETKVFKTNGEFKKCGCPKVDEYIELDFSAYNHPKDAQNGHILMCKNWALKN
ncbi:hypothetical protein GCL60_16695 [Silvanigrella paludirubra]|uniref:Uncharacterized protein n=1 Tax=Silvanigrella paludirubra TaxID=2499159 RepID=A0A6N6VMY6_9BACT|nr:hypothetical protein [Silvanigrella paludirubra]KAB8035868.1 hypothetical protein GCL60_16695 [Silvanigrella paludirubra]